MCKVFSYKPEETTCHSGGAEGADTIWEMFSTLYGLKVKAWSYKTKYHKSSNKIEVSKEDFEEGIEKIKKANKVLGRKNIVKHMNLLARNWAQVKYSEEIFAIGIIKSYSNGIVSGGTGWAVAMSIQNTKTVYVYDLIKNKWFKWSYIIDKFIEMKEIPIIQSKNFAGIGTRKLTKEGEEAIEDVFKKTYKV
jgi:hypothetical protein